jgi:FKBP-type peptidyl-prolyl cis-trans isomerase
MTRPPFWMPVLLAAATACGPAPTSPSHYAPFSQTDLVVGTGDEAVDGRLLTVDYTLWLYDATATDNKGVQLETSVGVEPLLFMLGNASVIRGWDQGVPGMRAGGVRRLVIPPSLGYGPTRNDIVPPNSTLIFEIELLMVEPV